MPRTWRVAANGHMLASRMWESTGRYDPGCAPREDNPHKGSPSRSFRSVRVGVAGGGRRAFEVHWQPASLARMGREFGVRHSLDLECPSGRRSLKRATGTPRPPAAR